MLSAQGPRMRARSPFAAAFLSVVFPGLGHAYAGAWSRALTFAAAPFLVIALLAGIVLRLDVFDLAGLALQGWVLTSIFVVNLIAMAYRGLVVIDAFRVTHLLNEIAASGDGRLGRARLPLHPVSVAGLAAVLLVMSGGHVVVARYDLLAMNLADCIFGDTGSCDDPGASPTPAVTGSASSAPVASATIPGQTVPPAASIPPWNGTERLDILLIGTDQRPSEGTFNTDTLIVVSIDPTTRQVAMFSLPRDTVDVPLPAGPVRSAYGPVYPRKINAFYTAIRNRADMFPGTDRTRGFNGLKAVLGELYGIDIRYYVEVNFIGFTEVVDAMGGATINVQVPLVDDHFPGENGRARRIYIPAGVQHMTGSEALVYARSRHGSNDFDRAQRQQRVLLSMREQADIPTLLPRVPELVAALSQTVRTDIPRELLPDLLGLAAGIDTKDIRSFVFTPPFYQTEFQSSPRGYILVPKLARIRAAVRDAFETDPSLQAAREALAAEGATVWVLNGSRVAGQAGRIAAYLEYLGVTASAPNQRPDGGIPANTSIVVYNGAELTRPATVALLEAAFGVTATLAADPLARTEIVITTGKATPDLALPSTP
ncbi:MAG: LCP family protein [Chloroflexota bacterium]